MIGTDLYKNRSLVLIIIFSSLLVSCATRESQIHQRERSIEREMATINPDMALDTLQAHLASSDELRRIAALRKIGQMKHSQEAQTTLEEVLFRTTGKTREAALEGLVYQGSASAMDTVYNFGMQNMAERPMVARVLRESGKVRPIQVEFVQEGAKSWSGQIRDALQYTSLFTITSEAGAARLQLMVDEPEFKTANHDEEVEETVMGSCAQFTKDGHCIRHHMLAETHWLRHLRKSVTLSGTVTITAQDGEKLAARPFTVRHSLFAKNRSTPTPPIQDSLVLHRALENLRNDLTRIFYPLLLRLGGLP